MEEIKANNLLDEYLKLEKDDSMHQINYANNLRNQPVPVKNINMITVEKSRKGLSILQRKKKVAKIGRIYIIKHEPVISRRARKD